MQFLKTMDLYKGIILLSLVLLPLGGWWVSKLDTEIKSCKTALREASKSGGWLEEIGSLQKKIEVVAQNRSTTSGAIQMPSAYFEGQVMAVSGDLKQDDFSLRNATQDKVTIGKQKLTDHVVPIDWGKGRDQKKFKMDFVYAVVFNCESGARQNMAVSGPPSVWRLRNLHLVNATDPNNRNKVPAPEMQDAWLIKEMKFARREPRK